MSQFFVRFVSTNIPESAKRGLLPDRLRRARKVFQFYLNHGIDIGAAQEAGTYAKRVDWEVPKIKTLWARANNVIKGRLVGNGVFINRVRFRSKQMDDLDVGDLHLAVVKVVHRRTGFTFTVLAIHRRTRTADPTGEDRRAMNVEIRRWIKSFEATGAAWVVIGDANEGEQWAIVDLGQSLGNHGVDHVVASRHFAKVDERTFDKPRLSDHDFLVVDAVVTL